MNKKAMFLILALLISLIISLGSVSAADDVVADINSIDDSISEVSAVDVPTDTADSNAIDISTDESNEKDTLSSDSLGDGDSWYVDSNVETTGDGSQASPYKTIKEAVVAANVTGTGTIYLADGIYSSADDRGLYFDAPLNVSIIGTSCENTVIDLLGSYQFGGSRAGATLSLSNLKFINGNSNYGAAVFNSGNMTIENCIFENNVANWYGGAFSTSSGNTTIKNCTFINNLARQGGALYINYQNWLNTSCIIEDSNFINNNYSISNGAAGTVYIVGANGYTTNVTFNGCNFSGSSQVFYLQNYVDLDINECAFFDNIKNDTSYYSYGCIMELYNNCRVLINGSTFENNTYGANSLIHSYNGPNNLTVTNSKFAKNIFDSDYAAILANYANHIFLENNTCDSVIVQLGMDEQTSGVTIESNVNLIVLNNETVDFDSPLISLSAMLTDDNGNLISYAGKQVKISLNDTELVSNLNFVGGYSNYTFKDKLNGTYVVKYSISGNCLPNLTTKTGVINVDPINDNVDIYVSTTGSDETGDGTEENPYATVEKALDAANAFCNANIYIKGGKYDYGTYKSIYNGNGIFNIIGYDGDVIIDMGGNSAFCNVTNHSNVVISNIAFINGYSTRTSIINSAGNLTLRNCNFTNNKGQYNTIVGASLVDSCVFTNNSQYRSSSTSGLDLTGVNVVVNSTFMGTEGSMNPSIVISSKFDSTTIEDCKFFNNASIYKEWYPALYIKSCEFNNPEVTSINVMYQNIEISDCTFINSSTASIKLSGSNTLANITNCKFINNTGATTNSAVFVNSIQELYLENNTVENNVAPYVYLSGSSSVTSPITINILNNETIEQESYGAILKAKILDDNDNVIAYNSYSFYYDFDGESLSASLKVDEMVSNVPKLLDGTYFVNADCQNFKDLTVKTAVLVITPLIYKDLYVSTTGSDETGDGTEANPYATLKKALDNAIAFNNTIHVAEGVYAVDTALDIDTNTAIVNILGSGENTIFDMGNAVSFISTLSANSILELKDLTLANAMSNARNKGGFITSAGKLTLNNVNLINSTASGTNGAAIRNTGNLTIVDSYFENTTGVNGGAIGSTSYLYVLNCIFNKTTATRNGGAIYSTNYLYIKNNTFIDTSATNGNNIFASNRIEGGVILTVMDNETWEIDSSSITLNASLTDENNNPIYSSGILVTFYLDGTKLASVNMNGDIVSTSTNLKLNGVHIVSATLGTSEDIIIKTATLNFANPDVLHDVYISVDGNDETGNGTSENPYASFTKALSVVESIGGTIHVMTNYTMTQDNPISNLYGLIIVGETDDINLKGATGTIFTINSGASLTFKNIIFTENTNTAQALILANGGSSLTLVNCAYKNNNFIDTYTRSIKFIDAYNGQLNLINCEFVNNNITTVYQNDGNLIRACTNSSFINCTFRDNNNSHPGQGSRSYMILVNNNQSYGYQFVSLFENCTFENNIGNLLYGDLREFNVINCSFIRNNGITAIFIGYNSYTRDNHIQNCTFEENNGSFLINSRSNYYVDILNNKFDSNNMTSYLMTLNYGANVVGNTIEDNIVPYVINVQNSGVHVIENTFKNNTANYLMYNANTATITSFDNVLSELGDAKYVYLGGSGKINGSTYTITVNDNETWDIEGNTIYLNASFMDAEGNYIVGYIGFTLNGEDLGWAFTNNIANYTAKYSGNGEVLASAHTNNVYNPDSLTIKTAIFNVTQLESKVIYVDVLGNDETGDGSEENPYATLLRAMKDVVATNNIIYIQPGVYDNLTAGDFELCDNQTLEIIGLSNEVDKVVIKNIDYRFIYLRYDSSKVSNDKFAIRNIDFSDITTNQYLFYFTYVDDVEFSNVNITNCTLTSSNYLIYNYFNHLTLSNVTISNLDYDYEVISADRYSTSLKPSVIEIYDSLFENFNTQNAYYTILFKQSAIIENSVFNNITSGSLFALNELNCTNSTFSNINCPNGNLITLISGQDSDNNIVGTVFTNCTVNDYIIDGYTNKLNVSNSVFASNTFRNIISGSNMVANNNWWGYNATAEDLVVYTTGNRVDNWIVAEVTANDSDIKIGDSVKFDIVLKLNDGSELTDILPTRIVKAIAENTVFDADEVEIADNKATITGTVNGVGDITISIDDQDFIFDVKGYNAYIAVENVAIKLGETATVAVTFTDDNGPLANKELAVKVNGEESTVTTDADGKATITLADLAKGNHIVEVNFAGDNLYDSVTGAGLVMVSDAVLTVDIPEVSYGESPTINVELKDSEGNPLSGLVTVNINGKDYNVLVKDGEGSLAVPDKFDAGEYTVSAKLIGDSITESTATFVVDKLASAMTVTVADVDYGEPFVINLDIADKTVSGLSIVTINGVDYAVEVVNGAASKAINAILPGGSYDVTAKFIGDNYDIADASNTFAVSEIVGTNVALTVKDIKYGENQTVTVTLTDANGNPISGMVKLTVGDIEQNITVDGEASVVLENLNAGNYAAIANYIGDDAYAPSNGYALFKVEKLTTYIDYQNMTTTAVDVDTDGRIGKYFYITLKDSNGKAIAGQKVQIGFNGVVYDRVTDDKGQARLQINLKNAGTYTFAVSCLGDENYNGSFIVAKIVVNKQKGSLTVPAKSYTASAKTKTLTATFKSASGKVVKGKKISFTLNGKTYTATTDAKGVAKVNVSISKKGTYTVTAKFAGNTMYDAITKTAKLTIK